MAYINGKQTCFAPSIDFGNDIDVIKLLENNFDENTELTVPVTSLNSYAFADIANVVSLILPNCVSVDNYAFRGMEDLRRISAPECTTFKTAFSSAMTSLDYLSLPKLTSIRNGVFQNMAEISELIIFIENPFTLHRDMYFQLRNIEGNKLTISIDTQDEDYEEALEYIQGLSFDEIIIYDENGELLDV